MSDGRCGAPTTAGHPCKWKPAASCPYHQERRGRPTKYREEYEEQVYKLCLLGATDEEIADFFGVAVRTIYNWAESHPGFLQSRKKGKEAADAKVAESLYHRALGYEHDAVKIMQHDGESYEHEYIKKYPPDTTAAMFWLQNRQPDKWRDRRHVEHAVEVSGRELAQEIDTALDEIDDSVSGHDE